MPDFRLTPVRVLLSLVALTAPLSRAGAQAVPPDETTSYAEALRTFEDRRFGTAAQQFEAFRDRFPRSVHVPDATYHEGAALLALGRDQDAVALLTRFEQDFPSHPLAFEARLALGQYYYDNGNAQEALTTLQQVLLGSPPDETAARALYWMGDAAVELDRTEDGLEYYRRAADEYPDTETAPKALYARAFTFVSVGRYEEGAQTLERLEARYTQSDLARNVGLALAEVYYEIGDYQRAVAEIRRRLPSLVREVRDRAEFLLAESYNQLRDSENAISAYRRFTEGPEESPYYRRAVYGLAWNYYHEGAHQWAHEQFARLVPGNDDLAIEALYYEGVNLAMAARGQDAAERFTRFADRYPDHELAPHALFELGVVQYGGRQWEDANATFGRLVESYPESDLAGSALTYLGNTFIALGDFDSALDAFDRAISYEAGDPTRRDEVLFQKAWLLYRSESYADAEQAFLGLYTADPSGPQAEASLFWSAESAFQGDRLAAAADRFVRYMRDFPGGRQMDAAHYALGWTYFRQQQYELAVVEFQRFLSGYREATESVPYRTDAELRLGDSYYALKDYANAVRVYGRLAADGDDYALYQIGQAYANSADPIEAIASFRRLLEEFPDSEWREEARYSLGYLFFRNQEYDQAITEYRTLIRDYGSHPLAAKAQYGIGDAYFNAGSLDRAIAEYRAVLERYPASPFAVDAAGSIQIALVAAGDEERAVAIVDSFAAAHPDSPLVDELRFRQAEVLYRSGRTDEARDDLLVFVRTARHEELLPEAYYYLGVIYADRGQAREAATYLGQILDRYPDSPRRPEAAAQLGRLYLESGNLDRALHAYDTLEGESQDDPVRHAEALYGRSMTLLAQGRMDEAERILMELVEDAPDDPSTAPAHLGLGRILEMHGEMNRAVTRYRFAATRSQGEAGAEALYRLGSLLRRTGDPSGAIEELTRIPVRFAGYTEWMARGYLEQARSLRDMGRPGEAVRLYETLISSYPQHPTAEEARRERAELVED
jgi:TolA-binding protein